MYRSVFIFLPPIFHIHTAVDGKKMHKKKFSMRVELRMKEGNEENKKKEKREHTDRKNVKSIKWINIGKS